MVRKDRTEYMQARYLKIKQKKIDEAKLKATPPPIVVKEPIPVVINSVKVSIPIITAQPLTKKERIRLKRRQKEEYDRTHPSWLDKAFNRLWWFEDGEVFNIEDDEDD